MAKAPPREEPLLDLGRYSWLPLHTIDPWVERVAARKGVGDVVRSPRGFLAAYRLAQGQPHVMGTDPYSGENWSVRRHKYIERLLAAMTKDKYPNGWDDRGQPTRRHLALMLWAYTPTPRRFAAWLKAQPAEWKPRRSNRGRKRINPKTIRLDEQRVMVEMARPPTRSEVESGMTFHQDALRQRWYRILIQPGKVKKSRE